MTYSFHYLFLVHAMSQRSKLIVKLAHKMMQENGTAHWSVIYSANGASPITDNLQPINNIANSITENNSNIAEGCTIVSHLLY